MLTKWGSKACFFQITNMPGLPMKVVTGTNNKGFITAKDYNGNTCYIGPLASYYSMGYLTNLSDMSSSGILFGTSDTEPTENDYCLGSAITPASLTISYNSGDGATTVLNGVYDADNNCYIAYKDYLVHNNTANDITIKEIGRFFNYDTAESLGGNVRNALATRARVMIDRTILDAPVTIPADTTKTIRYKTIYPGLS